MPPLGLPGQPGVHDDLLRRFVAEPGEPPRGLRGVAARVQHEVRRDEVFGGFARFDRRTAAASSRPDAAYFPGRSTVQARCFAVSGEMDVRADFGLAEEDLDRIEDTMRGAVTVGGPSPEGGV